MKQHANTGEQQQTARNVFSDRDLSFFSFLCVSRTHTHADFISRLDSFAYSSSSCETPLRTQKKKKKKKKNGLGDSDERGVLFRVPEHIVGACVSVSRWCRRRSTRGRGGGRGGGEGFVGEAATRERRERGRFVVRTTTVTITITTTTAVSRGQSQQQQQPATTAKTGFFLVVVWIHRRRTKPRAKPLA